MSQFINRDTIPDMRSYAGKITEIQVDHHGSISAQIECSPAGVPGAGQYSLASFPAEPDTPLGTPLFLAEICPGGFRCAPPVPLTWAPGIRLDLLGPLGRGFRLPPGLRRLACASLGTSISRLLPLVQAALAQGADVALFTDGPLPRTPASLEVNPLNALAGELTWPDLLALDLPAIRLPELRYFLRLEGAAQPPCPVQALIGIPMPCGGIADCGACAVPRRGGLSHGWKLACKDGPVFDLHELEW